MSLIKSNIWTAKYYTIVLWKWGFVIKGVFDWLTNKQTSWWFSVLFSPGWGREYSKFKIFIGWKSFPASPIVPVTEECRFVSHMFNNLELHCSPFANRYVKDLQWCTIFSVKACDDHEVLKMQQQYEKLSISVRLYTGIPIIPQCCLHIQTLNHLEKHIHYGVNSDQYKEHTHIKIPTPSFNRKLHIMLHYKQP